jgi:glutamyl-tRNA reductase
MKNMGAARHLIEVATGLDSMILGDVQILNQIRQHYQLASGLHTNGPILNKLLHVAIHAGKRSKSETEITKGSVSVSYAAVELAAKIYYNLNEKTALLIGAGETGELTAKHLINRGIHKLFITNRTSQKASELAAIMNATAIPYEEYPQQLLYSDIVITSVNSPEYIITTNQFSSIFAKQNHSPILMIDIGVPRNIDPELNTFENVFLHDMDSLSAIVEESLRNRHECIPEVNQIVAEELEEFSRWCRSHSVVPIVDELRLVFENIRNEELNYHIHKFREEDKELIEHLTRRIVYRLVEMPARELRNGETESQQQTELKISLLKKLFGLNEKSSEEADKI